MRIKDSSVAEHKVGAANCSLCHHFQTSCFNYYEFSSFLQHHTGLKAGYICDYCQHALLQAQGTHQ